MKTKFTHSPLPWQARRAPFEKRVAGYNYTSIYGPDDTFIADVDDYTPKTSVNEQKANGEFIIKAVNSHESLLEACKAAIRDIENPGDVLPRSRITLSLATQQQLREAISKSKEKP